LYALRSGVIVILFLNATVQEEICAPATTRSYETLGGVAPFDTSILRYPPVLLQSLAFDSMTYIIGAAGFITKPSLYTKI
jgi:hypothetical protein